jgi:hypothetical protein
VYEYFPDIESLQAVGEDVCDVGAPHGVLGYVCLLCSSSM